MTAYCIAVHPKDPELHCNRPGLGAKGNHPEHTAYSWAKGKYIKWPNEKYEPTETYKAVERKSKMKTLAERMRKADK